MLDLHELLAHEADCLRPTTAPPFTRLEVRARRRRRAKTIGAVTGSVAVVAALAIAVPQVWAASHAAHPSAAAMSGFTGTASGSDSGAFQATAAQVAGKLKAIGSDDPDFASVAVDAPNRAVIVHRKGGLPSDLYPKTLDGVPVEFGPALLSEAETNQTMDSIWAARLELEKVGITLTAVTTDGIGPVQVQVKNPEPTMAPTIAKYAPLGPSSFEVTASVKLMPAGRP